jgi:hypothetical protein
LIALNALLAFIVLMQEVQNQQGLVILDSTVLVEHRQLVNMWLSQASLLQVALPIKSAAH